jgi:hypothetical protein
MSLIAALDYDSTPYRRRHETETNLGAAPIGGVVTQIVVVGLVVVRL